MFAWIIMLAIAVCVALALLWTFGTVFGRGETAAAVPESRAAMAVNDTAITEGRFGDIGFELALRGYRQDQVDRVIDQLRAKIEQLEGTIDHKNSDRGDSTWQQ